MPPTICLALLSHFFFPWIIDSGASDHMSRSSNLFSDYKPYSGQDKVKIADGTFSSVSGKGLIRVTPLSLTSVLHVPSFSHNLLSLIRITRDLNCCVTFYPSHCVFQDLIMRRTIGSGREERGLYILDEGEKMANNTVVSKNKAEDLILWHRRLGHPSFSLLKHMFPSFVTNNVVLILLVMHANLENIIRLLLLLVIIKAQFLLL